jgi:hypothetical protein
MAFHQSIDRLPASLQYRHSIHRFPISLTLPLYMRHLAPRSLARIQRVSHLDTLAFGILFPNDLHYVGENPVAGRTRVDGWSGTPVETVSELYRPISWPQGCVAAKSPLNSRSAFSGFHCRSVDRRSCRERKLLAHKHQLLHWRICRWLAQLVCSMLVDPALQASSGKVCYFRAFGWMERLVTRQTTTRCGRGGQN